MSFAVHTAGASRSKILLVLRHIDLAANSTKTYFRSDLRQQQRNVSSRLRYPLIKEGDIVTVLDENNRNLWKLGRVESLITGRDNEIRFPLEAATNEQSDRKRND